MFEIHWSDEIRPPVSKYSRWYAQLVFQAKNRILPEGTYVENHHIIPKSFGGDNSKNNLVKLLAREHYIAHLLLWKMKFPGIYHVKMTFAFCTFMNKMQKNNPLIPSHTHSYKINSRLYQSFRLEYSQLLKEKWAREGANFKGCKHTEETKKIIGEKSKLKEFKRGPENPQWGKSQNVSAEGKQRRLEAVRQMWDNPIKKQEILEKRQEAANRPGVVARRKALADSRRGVPRDPAIIEKGAAKRRGKKGTELFSEQALKNIREAAKNRVLTPETKARMSFKGKGLGIAKVKKPCTHCGKLCAGNMLAKWHGDNCKRKIVDE
jgi:hypothetical protein